MASQTKDQSEQSPTVTSDAPSDNVSAPAPATLPATSQDIDFVTKNEDQAVTIILIHGAEASGSDWSLVVPYLSSYHLLIPSLFTPKSLDLVRQMRRKAGLSQKGIAAVERWDSCYVFYLANLIKKHAKNGRAHFAGLSFGACLAAKLTARHPDLCLSTFCSGLPMLVTPSFYSLTKPVATRVVWFMQTVVKNVGAENVSKFLEGEVHPDPGAWDGKGGGPSVEMSGIIIETIMYSGQGEYYVETINQDERTIEESQAKSKLRMRFVAGSRKNRWTPVADSPEWATEVSKIMIGERKGPADPAKGDLIDGIDCKVYEAKRMFHAWNRQNPELFAQCILATVAGTDFPAQGLQEVWAHPSKSNE